MRNFYCIKPYLMAMLLAIGSLCAVHGAHAKTQSAPTIETFSHNIQLQLSDSNGFPVDGTQFWVTLDVIKQGSQVTLQFPVINFQTLASQSAENPLAPGGFFPGGTFIPGGYLYTSAGFLPESIRPNDLVNRSLMGASNNGTSEPFSFAQPISTLPTPPVGYIVQITSAGEVVIQCTGTFGNIIPVGPQTLLPADITYIVKPQQQLRSNTKISTGATNTTQFTGGAANDGFRDSHVNDAFDGIAAWAWTDNSMIADKTNNTMNAMVAIGSVDANGRLQVGTPVQLTNFIPGFEAWDTAVAINRDDPNNVVVSYGILDHRAGVSPHNHPTLARAVSFDGGKTWPALYDGITPETNNGPINVQPVNGAGDMRGVASDKFGYIWYGATERGVDGTSRPIFYVSINKGVTYQFAFEAPAVVNPLTDFYDSPQFCFGTDQGGNYGLYLTVPYYDFATFDGVLVVGFAPITGLGLFGSLNTIHLTQFTNNAVQPEPTASNDGRLWISAYSWPFASSYVEPGILLFKSPGALDENYAGPWDYSIFKNTALFSSIFGFPSGIISQPADGYIATDEPTSILYDNARQALYKIYAQQSPNDSQNMRIPFIISRDNGQTWSNPIDIPTTNFANRGFQSMALDETTGNLFFGWYDGRNDPTFESVEYFGAVIPAAQLDCLVSQIPLSNPLYTIPAPITS